MFDSGQIIADATENKELWYKAEMTYRQFASISHKWTQNHDT